MTRIFQSFLLCCVALTLCLTGVFAQGISNYMPYQGFLSDNLGQPITGVVNITFKLYEEQFAATSVWEETIQGVQVQNGAFSSYLGQTSTNLRDYLTSGRAHYIGISVNDNPEMSPRQRLGSLPYAFLSYNASRLEGRPVADFITREEIDTLNGGLSEAEINALIDARSYLNEAAITVLINNTIDNRNYLTDVEINTLISNEVNTINQTTDNLQTEIDNLRTELGEVRTIAENAQTAADTAQAAADAAQAAADAAQAAADAAQAAADAAQATADAAQNNATSSFILGVSTQSDNGFLQFNNKEGVQAAGEMCKTSFPNDPTAHYCSVSEIQSALSTSSFNPAIDNVSTWAYPTDPGQGNNGYCQSLLYLSAHRAVGTTVEIDINAGSDSGGTGARLIYDQNVNCATAHPVLCCR